MSHSIQLYVDDRFCSPWAMAVYVTLIEKKLPFSLHGVDLKSDAQHAPEYLAHAPTNRVPAIVIDGFALTESTAIIEYLEEQFPNTPSVLPKNRESRAHARQIMGWIRSDLGVIRNERSTETVFYAPATVPLSKDATVAGERLFRVLNRTLSQGAPHLFDNAWSIADLDAMMMLIRFVKSGDPMPAHLRDYALAQWARPSVQQWVQMSRKPL